jgi:hypothetical protein
MRNGQSDADGGLSAVLRDMAAALVNFCSLYLQEACFSLRNTDIHRVHSLIEGK